MMDNRDYFKLQAKNLLKDINTRYFDEEDNSFEYDSKFFDVKGIFRIFDIDDSNENFKFSLSNAQNLVANIVGFDNWKDLIHSPTEEQTFAREMFKNSFCNAYKATGFIGHNFNGYDEFEYLHNYEDDTSYYEELTGEEWQKGIDECCEDNMGFDMDEIVECLHCGNKFHFKEVKVRHLKPEYNDNDEDVREIVCKHYPECNGNLLDLMPIKNDESDNE